MKKISALLTLLIIVGIFVPAVSAEPILDENPQIWVNTGGSGSYTSGEGAVTHPAYSTLRFTDISKASSLNYIAVSTTTNMARTFSEGVHPLEYTLNGETHSGVFYVDYSRNWLGQITATRFTIFFYDWNIGSLTGQVDVPINVTFWSGTAGPMNAIFTGDSCVRFANAGSDGYNIVVSSGINWQNHLHVTSIYDNDMQINLQRVYNSNAYLSTLTISDGVTNLYSSAHSTDVSLIYPSSMVNNIKISAHGNDFVYPIGDVTPITDDTPVTIYVRNSQTGALLANAHLEISANVNGNFHEVVNETVPSGIYSIELQPTGGGMPNPDFYRLIPAAEGYNSIMPYIDFEVDGATSIYAYLDPIGGAPEDENKTFIDFYVRDLAANAISGATVKFDKYTLITNNAGYTVFEVDKNNAYTWTISKSGYSPLTGNVVIADDPRNTINTVLAPIVTPTTSTTIPTSTPIGPTPTLTAPTGEPTSNLLEWFAAHFGMILGGGVEIGKIFMWLCFSVPVGVYVGKEAKAGAAGFMAGAGIVTLFFVLIGWVPIWLLVLLALIIGLLYAKVFNNSDTGGGR